MRKLLAVFAAAAALVGVTGLPRADAAPARSHQANGRLGALRVSNQPEYSVNWSGYAVVARAGEQISAVSAQWVVPLVRAAPPGLSSSWIGIGGYASNDLIQAGTASGGRLDGTYAWYEVLPQTETLITSGCQGDGSCHVATYDRVGVSIANVGANDWAITMTNYGTGGSPKWTWSRTVTYASSLSSAEYVFEAPQLSAGVGFGALGLGGPGVQTIPANAPHAKFLGGSTYRVNGVTRPLAGASVSRIFMVDRATGSVFGGPMAIRMATPSPLAGDGHFQVCAYKRTCPNY